MLLEHAYLAEEHESLRSSSSSPADLNFYASSGSPPPSSSPPSPRPPVSEVTYSHLVRGSIVSVPKSWQAADNGERLVLNVYSFLRTLLGASGSSQGAIDNRIEQAMDLVKSHLMTAVRSGVEELKEKIIRLEDTISHLQTENDFLKAHVPNEVLAQLHQYTSLAHLAAAGVMLPPSAAQHVVMMPPQPGSSPTGLSSSAPQK